MTPNKYNITLSLWVGLMMTTMSIFAQNIIPTPSAKSSLQQLNRLYQCQNCDLHGINLENYSPADQAARQGIESNCTVVFNLSFANLQRINMQRASLVACLRGNVTPFAQINFSHANFTQADLSDSHFYGADFSYANFSQSHWSHTSANLCNFTSANFTGADLQYMQSQADAMHGFGSNFYKADFSEANLSYAKLYGFFRSANFSHAVLRDAIISTTTDTIDPSLPNWQHMNSSELWAGVNFTDADLTGARFIATSDFSADSKQQTADLQQAIFCHTIMPDGTVNNRNCSKASK